MKRSWIFALAFAVGCASSEEEPAPEAAPAPRPVLKPSAGREGQLSSLRSQLASKKADQAQAEADLARIAAEREELNAQGASDGKTTRLAQIATLEAENKRKKQALALDIADLENKIRDASAGTKSGGEDALAAALAEDAAAEKERAERRKIADEANRADEARKVAAAETARRAEEEARAKNKIESAGDAKAGPDAPLFEDRMSAQILRLRAALQEFKRW
jgi:hypothetical protein